jgi:hypothetical protein
MFNISVISNLYVENFKITASDLAARFDFRFRNYTQRILISKALILKD